MEEQFEYGEEVMVRDHDTEAWNKAYYLMTAPKGKKRHWGVAFPLTKEWLDHEKATWVQPFAQIRKIQKPEPALIDIEQPKQGTIEYLQEQVEFLQKRLIELELKFEAKEIDEFKTQLK